MPLALKIAGKQQKSRTICKLMWEAEVRHSRIRDFASVFRGGNREAEEGSSEEPLSNS